MSDQPIDFNRPSRRVVAANLKTTFTGPPEFRSEANIPVGCPIDRASMLAYVTRMWAAGNERFDPCNDCEFFRLIRLGADAGAPTRDSGDWFDYGLCVAPERASGPALVNKKRISGYARKRFGDDPTLTNEKVLEAVDEGAVSVREIVFETGLAERTVFKVLARLRSAGVLAHGAPIRRSNRADLRDTFQYAEVV